MSIDHRIKQLIEASISRSAGSIFGATTASARSADSTLNIDDIRKAMDLIREEAPPPVGFVAAVPRGMDFGVAPSAIGMIGSVFGVPCRIFESPVATRDTDQPFMELPWKPWMAGRAYHRRVQKKWVKRWGWVQEPVVYMIGGDIVTTPGAALALRTPADVFRAASHLPESPHAAGDR